MHSMHIEFHLINLNSVKLKADLFRGNNSSLRKRTVLAELRLSIKNLKNHVSMNSIKLRFWV